MAVDSRANRKLYYLPSFTTYGALPKYSYAETYHSDRSRSWSRGFKSRRAAYASLLQNGYLPTQAYTDSFAEGINSKAISFEGLFNRNPESRYSWTIIPGTARYIVESDDNWFPALESSVLAQLASRISGHGTNLAVTAFEAEQTVGMIGTAVGRVFKAYRHVRHGNFAAAAKALNLKITPHRVGKHRSFNENWLEYRYGWRLVVQDVAGLMNTLYDSLTMRPPVLRVTALAKRTGRYNWNTGAKTMTMPDGTSCWKYSNTKKVTVFDAEVRGGYIYKLESVALSTGQSLGLTNPLLFAWEIIPYSFVIDWFVNVGDVLSSLSAFQGKTCLDGWLCKMIQSSTEYFWTGGAKTSSVYSCHAPSDVALGPVKDRRFLRSRISFTGVQIRVDLDLNIPRTIDAIGLLAQQSRRK